MEVLIIGAEGFVGSYLIQEILSSTSWNITGTYLNPKDKIKNVKSFQLDITDEKQIFEVLSNIQPDIIIHLAAQSSVSISWQKPKLTVDVNILGVINLLTATKNIVPKARILLIGSSEEYGKVDISDNPISENHCPNPSNLYAVTKITQNYIGKIFHEAYQLDIVMTRSFNHIGPGQLPTFVVSDFCQQITQMEKGERDHVLHVGNLDAERDFTDVRDITKAYLSLINSGISGETYNIGSGTAIKIQSILDLIIKNSKVKPLVVIDQNKYRPIDVLRIVADTSKIKKITAWRPLIELEQTIIQTLDYWRTK